MEIVKPQKGTSWTDILTNMSLKQRLPTDLKSRNTVAPLISRQLSLSHPDMEWRTEKTGEKTMDIIREK